MSARDANEPRVARAASSTGRLLVGGRSIDLRPDETVLEALEREGFDAPSGCRSGSCTKCMLRGEGAIPPESCRALRPTLVEQGYFLACRARPVGELSILDANGPEPVSACVEEVERVAEDVVRLLLRPERHLVFRAGQYFDVLHPGGARRSYSCASLPATGRVEMHVRRIPGGLVSSWMHGLDVGARLSIRGPFGQCFYLPDEPAKKLVLAGVGTGLAPLLGILRDGIEHGHEGPIDLVHGGLDPSRLYLRDELAELAAGWPRLRVHHGVLRGATGREHEGALPDVVRRTVGSLRDARAYLCGDDALVRQLQRSLFLDGVPSREILADPFSPQDA